MGKRRCKSCLALLILDLWQSAETSETPNCHQMKEADRDRLPENQLQLSNSVWSPLLTRRRVAVLNCLTKPPKTSPTHLPWLSTFRLQAPALNCIHSRSGSSLRSAPGEICPTIPKCDCWTFPSHSSPDPWFRDPCYRRRPKCHPGKSMKCSSFPNFWFSTFLYCCVWVTSPQLVNALCCIHYRYILFQNSQQTFNLKHKLHRNGLRWQELPSASPPFSNLFEGLRERSTSNRPPNFQLGWAGQLSFSGAICILEADI